jgi:DNA-binding LytR/AlgR family response regulator
MDDIRILIVEDEPIIADDIAMVLENNGFSNSDICDNANEAIKSIILNKPSLALLDINILGDKDGIQLAQIINDQHQIPFVFITSYYDDSTLIRAKETNPTGYIVKPFAEGDLLANVKLALVKSKAPKVHVSDKFFVRDKGNLKSIFAHEILYAESDDNYAKIYTADRNYMVSHTLKSVEEQLSKWGFVRIHKSFLVNYKHVTCISEGLVYVNDQSIPLGRAYKESFLQLLHIL